MITSRLWKPTQRDQPSINPGIWIWVCKLNGPWKLSVKKIYGLWKEISFTYLSTLELLSPAVEGRLEGGVSDKSSSEINSFFIRFETSVSWPLWLGFLRLRNCLQYDMLKLDLQASYQALLSQQCSNRCSRYSLFKCDQKNNFCA